MRGVALLLLATSWTATIEAKTILVLGDSISAAYGIQREQGWVALLEARVATLAEPHQVVNASISGDTTVGALARLPRALEVHEPDLVVIEIGGNDALRGYPIDRIEHNLDAMIRLSKDAGAAVLVLGMEIPPNYGARYTQAFSNVYSQVARRSGSLLVPFLLDGVATDAALMQADGIHPTAAAQPRLLENVWPALEKLL